MILCPPLSAVCPLPADKQNAVLSYGNPDKFTWDGDNITYSCNARYWFPNEQQQGLTFHCDSTGVWNPNPAVSDCAGKVHYPSLSKYVKTVKSLYQVYTMTIYAFVNYYNQIIF